MICSTYTSIFAYKWCGQSCPQVYLSHLYYYSILRSRLLVNLIPSILFVVIDCITPLRGVLPTILSGTLSRYFGNLNNFNASKMRNGSLHATAYASTAPANASMS